MATSTPTPIPSYVDPVVVIPAPGPGAGNWAGAASAVLVDGTFWLTWRTRRPLTDGRGVTVTVARSDDGITFTPVAQVEREAFGAESFERPVLVQVPGIGWRLYLSCATPNSKHWWVETLTAGTVADLPRGERTVTNPGDEHVGVKDPVVRQLADGTWEMFLCCHPLDDPGQEDRMTSRRLTSHDGLHWTDRGEVLAPTPGSWDARGARITTVVSDAPLTVLYDGRPDAESNWAETTGIARADGDRLVADPDAGVLRSPFSDGAFRYASAVPLPDGRTRFYAEVAREDGAHDLVSFVS